MEYKARDIDFKAAMQSALNGVSNENFNLSKTSAQHLDSSSLSNSIPNSTTGGPLFRPNEQGSVDGNTVDLDVERNQFADNGLRYEASLTMINTQLKQMLTALQS